MPIPRDDSALRSGRSATWPAAERERLAAAIDRLTDEPHAGGALKGELSGLRRVRVGRYRIVYEALDRELTVLLVRIGHRREAYR